MADTANLILPLMAAAQSQKHVTHNEAVLRLDVLVQLAVKSTTLTSPPVSPADGDRYLIASGSTGAWAGKDLNITYYSSGAWVFLPPRKGWLCWDEVNGVLLTYKGSPSYWTQDVVNQASLASLLAAGTPATRIGINTASDTDNRLAVKANSFFFSHDDVTPGTGDIRGSLNKSASAKDASIDFKTAWSTRALFGLLADDDVRLKVSSGGSTYYEAWSVDRTSGLVRMPNGASVKGVSFDTQKAIALAQTMMLGPTSVQFRTTGELAWTGRFIAISGGRGSHFSSSGFFNIEQPPAGTVIPGYGGASSVTATANGVPMVAWSALYYELPIGASATSLASNYRIAQYGADLVVPANWVLIALVNGDTLECRLGNGEYVYQDTMPKKRDGAYMSRTAQPAFHAYGAAGGDVTSATFVFSNKMTDVGNDYSTSTGYFTCPMSGRYVFNVFLLFNSAGTNDFYFRKNNVNLPTGRVGYSAIPGATYIPCHASIVLDLVEGDTVSVYMGTGIAFGGGDLSYFNGHYISSAY